jgi:hypothetical protein
MRPEEFLDMLRPRPFIPLRIHMTDGSIYELRHPDNVFVLRSRVDIGVRATPGSEIVDHVDHLSLLHIVRVEQLPTHAQTSGNGD